MDRNVGPIDRVIRIVIAIVAVAAAVAVGAGTVGGIILLVVAAIMAVTGLAARCPLYRLVGLSTCPVQTRTYA